jgi:hypothetical protein
MVKNKKSIPAWRKSELNIKPACKVLRTKKGIKVEGILKGPNVSINIQVNSEGWRRIRDYYVSHQKELFKDQIGKHRTRTPSFLLKRLSQKVKETQSQGKTYYSIGGFA